MFIAVVVMFICMSLPDAESQEQVVSEGQLPSNLTDPSSKSKLPKLKACFPSAKERV